MELKFFSSIQLTSSQLTFSSSKAPLH